MPDTSPSSRPLVLVVDDDPELRAYVRAGLSTLPVRVAEASNGLEALDHLRSHDDVGLVITDLHMEPMDGRALKAVLAADPAWAAVPVLLITGESVRARDGPVLRKPFSRWRLTASARALLLL